ncbi:MAG TPA: hypothetical protein VN310_18345 [Candidatus Dormibacteraeota bacterium]|nr:hypothetical protein [Candidatus Dormibacteraeota bacterium]
MPRKMPAALRTTNAEGLSHAGLKLLAHAEDKKMPRKSIDE